MSESRFEAGLRDFSRELFGSATKSPMDVLRARLLPLLEAAEGIKHWHDWGKDNEGMVVSAEHVHKLWKELSSWQGK